MKRALPAIVFLIILVGLYAILQKPSGREQELEKVRTQYVRRLDSLNYAFTGLRLKDSLLVVSLEGQKKDLSERLKTASKQKVKYEQIMPVTNPDSLVELCRAIGYPVVLYAVPGK